MSEEISIGELVYKAYVKNYLIAHLRYLKAVGERIGMEEALKILERVQWEAGREWFKENGSKLDLITDDAKAGVVLVRRAMKTIHGKCFLDTMITPLSWVRSSAPSA